MKRILSIILVILAITMAMTAVIVPTAAENDNTAYVYPVVPGSNEWNLLKNAEEKRAACAVDIERLNSMSTEALVKTVVTYPLLPDMYAYDTIGQGLKAIESYFAGVDILLARKDALEYLSAYAEKEHERTEYTPIAYYNADTLIKFIRDGESTVLDSVNSSNRIEGSGCAETTADGLIFPAAVTSYYLDYVWTPNGTPIAVYVGLDWANHNTTYQQAKAEMIALMGIYPGAVKLSDPVPGYNCHSYAWYAQAGNNYWMDYPNAYITDGSYISASAAAGVKVTYSSGGSYIHSGIVSSAGSTVRATSKWGCLGVLNHAVDDCPYYGSTTTVQYWQAS